jgi:hypothetical protein
MKDKYIIMPTIQFIDKNIYFNKYGNDLCQENWEYNSFNNDYIKNEELENMLNDFISFK